MRLATDRLDLVACTPEVAQADLDGDRAALAELLRARVPDGWPPLLWSDAALRHQLDWMAREPHSSGWGAWYVLLRADALLVGAVGLKGRPSADGTAEIGYTFAAEAHGRGYATEASRALVEFAFADPGVRRVVAQTFPNHWPSIRVMERLGFSYSGPGTEEGTICYEILRS
jgi:RimJ/RimL family protein N-acetyltransferase